MGFLGVGEGCGIVVNDTAATKLNGLEKKWCPLQPSLSVPRQGVGAASGGGSSAGAPCEQIGKAHV